MKKLLLSTLILTSGFMLAPFDLAQSQPQTQQQPSASSSANAGSGVNLKLAEMRKRIQDNKKPIADRLVALDKNIQEMITDYGSIADSLLDDDKIEINAALDLLNTEANDLWTRFGGSTFKWYCPSQQSKELQTIARHFKNIDNLYNKINPTSIIMKPVYNTASWMNKNKIATVALAFGAYFTSNYWAPAVKPATKGIVALAKFLATPLHNPWAATTVAEATGKAVTQEAANTVVQETGKAIAQQTVAAASHFVK